VNTTVQIANETIEVDLDSPIDISIPLNFNGPQPNAFGVEPATSKACAYGSLVGDTRLGGSVNFEQYTFIPHCNGTHTECVGHITNSRISVRDCLQDLLIRALLISISPQSASHTTEGCSVGSEDSDVVITRLDLEKAMFGR